MAEAYVNGLDPITTRDVTLSGDNNPVTSDGVSFANILQAIQKLDGWQSATYTP